MAANVEQSKIMAQLKQKSKGSWKRSRKVEPKARGQGGFPPNLKNLVAKVTEYKFAKTEMKEGKGGDPYFSLSAIVVEPEEYAGRRAAFNWFLNESEWATYEENEAALANDLALLAPGIGPDTEIPEDIADVPAFMQELIDNEVHLIFNTGGPRKNGRPPNLFIQGVAEGYVSGAGDTENADEATEEGTEEEVAEEAEESAEDTGDDSGVEAEEESPETDEAEWAPGDQYSVVISKDDPRYCEIVEVKDDGKLKVKMLDGPNKGKVYAVDPAKMQSYDDGVEFEPKKAPKKPAKPAKPAGKGGKKK